MRLLYPSELPISACREDIIRAIGEHRVLIVAGDTGSGKTTQLPKMCLQAGRGRQGRIGCTQPRRIAAISVAQRVAEELGDRQAVGYKIRFQDQTGPATRIKFMTDGVLLAETRQDRLLRQYDTIIVDEAHERSRNIDFLLGILKNLLARRVDLHLIISSATIDTEKFSRHFDDAPVIQVSGRTWPITIEYVDPEEEEERGLSHVDLAVRETIRLATGPDGGDILVFMPTESDIFETIEGLGDLEGTCTILPLFGRLQAQSQRRIFRPSSQRKIIVATNVAETSITVPGIRFVVDTGLARISRYNVRSATTSLLVSPVSRASCDQRAGRCGRTGPGLCIRLYSEADYASRPEFTLPEILRSNLAEVILQMIDLGLGDPRRFPFVDRPPDRTIRDGYRTLGELGALDRDNRLTGRGRIMARLPLDPRISRIIIEAAERNCLAEILVIGAALSIQDPRVRPAESQERADQAHGAFTDRRSDFLTWLRIWQAWQEDWQQYRSRSRLKKFCKQHFLSWQRMREWFDVHSQISRIVREQKGFRLNDEPAPYGPVHQALAAGFLRNICQKKEKNLYLSATGREVTIFPGSGLYNHGPPWIMAADFVRTSRLFARTAARIEPEWLERLGGDLCRYSWTDPHWEKKAGQVVALERVSLFGLVILAGRRVNFGRTSPANRREARGIFIDQALVRGRLGGRYPFLRHNLALSRKLEAMEDRLRRRDILVDERVLQEFYDQRLPDWVHDRSTLNRLLKKRRGDDFLRMREADICRSLPDGSELYRFPPVLRAGSLELPLHYRFEPGSEEDGITVDLPLSALPTLDPALFEWLVPGLLPEKILHLLRRLPKRLRRHLVPLPEAAERILDGLDLYRGSLYPALERIIFREYQVTVRRTDWQTDTLPVHLKMRFNLCDEQGRVLRSSRSLADLRQGPVPAGDRSLPGPVPELPELTGITRWCFDDIEARLAVYDRNGRLERVWYPALIPAEDGSSLNLRYLDDERRAFALNRQGLRLLYGFQVPGELKKLRRECKAAVASHTASWLALGQGKTAAVLRNQLLDFLLDALFAIRPGPIPGKEEFLEHLHAAREQGILRRAGHLISQVVELLAARRETASLIDRHLARAKKNRNFQPERFEDYRQRLEEIVPADFLLTTGADHLADRKRYLKALAIRMERAEQNPARDAKKAEQLVTPLNRLDHLAAMDHRSPACEELIQEYRRMLDEFRVSLFAPELGTAFPVSAKRLTRKWRQIQEVCHAVE